MFSTSVKVVDVDLQVTVAQCQAFSSMTRASERKGWSSIEKFQDFWKNEGAETLLSKNRDMQFWPGMGV